MLSTTILYVFGITLFAGFMQTLTGFGFALVATPLLGLILGPKQAVFFVLVAGMLLRIIMLVRTRDDVELKGILHVFAASVIGALPGAYILKVVNDSTLKVLIGVVLVIVTTAMYANYSINIRRQGLAKSVVGLLSGFLGATTSFNGPPLVFYMMNQGEDKIAIRAWLAQFFLLGNAATLVISYFMGSLAVSGMTVLLISSIPAIILGWLLGERIFNLIDGTLFRKIALAVIAFSAIATIGSGIWPLVHS